MRIRSLRRVTDDIRHNAFTGACWFQGNLYIAYRQGDAHVCEFGRNVVLRSRDGGISWDHVAVIRGPGDTRDAHLYTDGKRLYAVGFVWDYDADTGCSGCAHTDDGDRWTSWTPYRGTTGFLLWRPQFWNGRHYCAAYNHLVGTMKRAAIHWFESKDGIRWKDVREIYEGVDLPNECSLEILEDGTATMLMRCEGGPKHPWLCRSKPPFHSWKMTRLADIAIGGPCLWTVDSQVYIGVRWLRPSGTSRFGLAQTAIFRVLKNRTDLEYVFPSGGWDHSYMGVARHPENRHRFALSFYSDGIAPTDPAICQWDRPDIYLADVVFAAEFLTDDFKVSKCIALPRGLSDAKVPDPAESSLGFRTLRCDPRTNQPNFLDVSIATGSKPGVVYIVRDIEIGPIDRVRVHLGYDGPVRVWWNGREVFAGQGTNPAIEDQTSLALDSQHGTNRLGIALDTNGGKAQGIFARWEPA